jgi:hypothetical protein
MRADALAGLLAQDPGVTSAVVDDQYTLTAVMVERDCCGRSGPVLVELIENHERSDDAVWLAVAIDDFGQTQSPSSRGETPAAAIRGIDWCDLRESHYVEIDR